jgi:hypothetical protein
MPTAAAMSFSDVPSYPWSAKYLNASARMASRVEGTCSLADISETA